MIGPAQRHQRAAAIGGEAHAHRQHLVGRHAGHGKAHLLHLAAAGDIDDVQRAAQLGGGPQLLAIGGELGVARADAHLGLVEHPARGDVDPVQLVVGLRGGHHPFAIGRGCHALRFHPHHHLEGHPSPLDVDRRHLGITLVAGKQGAPIGRQGEHLRILARGQVGNHLAGGNIEHLHGILVAGADVKMAAVLRQDDAARPLAHRPARRLGEAVAVDHADQVGALVGDIDGLGKGGAFLAGAGDAGRQRGEQERADAHDNLPR